MITEWQAELLADEIAGLARKWADGNAELLRQAERILAKTKYLEGGEDE